MSQQAVAAEVLIKKAMQVAPQKKLKNPQEVAEARKRKVQVAPRKRLRNPQEVAEAQQNEKCSLHFVIFLNIKNPKKVG